MCRFTTFVFTTLLFYLVHSARADVPQYSGVCEDLTSSEETCDRDLFAADVYTEAKPPQYMHAYVPPFSETCEVLVKIESGPVCGRVLFAEDGSRYYSFRGIPYAKPPLGYRRFQVPEEMEPWTEPFFALVEGPACPQRNLLYGHMPTHINGQSEDCLYVNIHIPGTATLNQDKSSCGDFPNCPGLPILLHIPGGGFFSGSGHSDMHGPEYLIPKNIIVVTFNYRINVFGFMCFNSEKIACNRGLWDMVAVIKWVNRNARAFGGNPEDVTLMGHSAGSAAAHLISFTDHAKGLYKRLILASGTAIPNFFTANPAYAEYTANMLFERLGLNSSDPDKAHEELIEMPLNRIMDANDFVHYQTGIVSFVPMSERDRPGTLKFLEDEPITLIGKGRGKNLPTLVSFTNNESAFFTWLSMIQDSEDRLRKKPGAILNPRLFFSLSEPDINAAVEKVYQEYFNGNLSAEKMLSYFSDIYFKYPVYKLVEWRVALDGAPIYFSQFSYESNNSLIKHGLWNDYKGACHMEDTTYIFRTNAILNRYWHQQQSERDYQMVEWMTTIITNFMRCSNPTCIDDELSPWPPVRREDISYQDIEEPMVYKMMSLLMEDKEMIELFDSIDPDSRELSLQLQRSS